MSGYKWKGKESLTCHQTVAEVILAMLAVFDILPLELCAAAPEDAQHFEVYMSMRGF